MREHEDAADPVDTSGSTSSAHETTADDAGAERAGRDLNQVSAGIYLLTLAAGAAVVLYLATSLVIYLGQRNMAYQWESGTTDMVIIGSALTAGWGYLLVAVVAYAAALALRHGRIADALSELERELDDA